VTQRVLEGRAKERLQAEEEAEERAAAGEGDEKRPPVGPAGRNRDNRQFTVTSEEPSFGSGTWMGVRSRLTEEDIDENGAAGGTMALSSLKSAVGGREGGRAKNTLSVSFPSLLGSRPSSRTGLTETQTASLKSGLAHGEQVQGRAHSAVGKAKKVKAGVGDHSVRTSVVTALCAPVPCPGQGSEGI